MKKQLLITSLLALTASSLLLSQEPVIQWENTIGGSNTDEVKSVIQTSDGGYLLGGHSKSGMSGDKTEANFVGGLGFDYWVVKTDGSGNIIWQNTIGGTGDDYLSRVIETSDGGYLLGGYSNSPISGDKTEASLGSNDYWIVKIDAAGNIVWQNTIGGSASDVLTDFVKLPSGDFVLAGYSSSGISGDKTEATLGDPDYWVVKINSTGTIVWQNTIGGNNDDILNSITKTSDGGFLLSGTSNSPVSGDKTIGTIYSVYNDYWVVKISNLGVIVWQNVIGGDAHDHLISAVKNADGSFTLAGYSESENSGNKSGFNTNYYCGGGEYCLSEDYWIVTIDINGNILWERTVGDGGEEYVTSIVASGDGGYIIGSYVDFDLLESSSERYYRTAKVSDNGYLIWSKDVYGSTPTANYTNLLQSVITTSDGGYLLAGYSNANSGVMKAENCIGGTDYWIVKLAPETCVPSPIYSDEDGDGKGQDYLASTCEFTPGKWVDNQDDCDDNHAMVSLTMDELCDGMDNNCDALVDVGCEMVPVIEWNKTISGDKEDKLYAITTTMDGGYILAGTSHSGISGDKTEGEVDEGDYWIVKTNSSGDILWQNTIGSLSYDELTAIDATPDGGYILGGRSYKGEGGGDKTELGVGSYDYWLIKVDASGSIVWQNTIGGTGWDALKFVRYTSDGGFIAGGESTSGSSGDKSEANLGSYDYWIIKLDAVGNIVWENTIGGSNADYAVSAIETPDAGFIIGGYSVSGISGDKTDAGNGSYDYWVIKLNASGGIVWQNAIGGSGGDYLTSISSVSDGGYIVAGYSSSGISGDKTENFIGAAPYQEDYWIVKLDGSGNVIWENTIGGTNEDFATTAIELNDGGFLIGGYSRSTASGDKIEGFIPSFVSSNEETIASHDYWVLRTNSSGEIIWQNTIGGNYNDELATVLQTDDNGFLLAGSSGSLASSDKTQNGFGKFERDEDYNSLLKDNDFWIIKLAPECSPTAESCNAIDDNCNGLVDDGVAETISIIAGGATTFCQGGSVLLSATHSGTSIQWKKNGVNIPGATNLTYSVNKSGSYTAVTTSPCDTETSNTIAVTVNKNPNASISAAGSTTFCAGGSVTLNVTPVGGSTYQWYKGAMALAGATNTSYVATTAGNYKCRVTKTATGCYKNSNSIAVTVPCREGEITNNSFTIYPNPAHDQLTLTAASSTAGSNWIAAITDASGRLIAEYTIHAGETIVDISNYAPGVYFVKSVIDGEQIIQKLIIQ